VRRDVDVVVAEVSSFQLRFTDSFHPAVAVWLNLAEDHLDWHPDLDAYAAAKARIWAHQTARDVAVVNADDSVVMAWAAKAPSRVVTFGLREPADYLVDGGWLRGPEGPLAAVADLRRARELGADPAVVSFDLALVNLARGEHGAALDELRRALSHDPHNSDARKLHNSLPGR
jgi:UDP-N-acetylmuramoylalanine-D-glutamate ligase